MTVEAIRERVSRLTVEPGSGGRAAEEAALDARLDRKTRALALLAVAAALRLEARLLPCVAEARLAGAARDEVVGAILAGVPAAGLEVLSMVPPAIRAFDAPYRRGQD